MSAIENLTQNVSALTAKVTEVQTAIAALKAVPNNDAAIQSAADGVAAATAALGEAIQ